MSTRRRNKKVRNRDWKADDTETLRRESRARREDSGGVEVLAGDDSYFTDIEPNATVISPYGVLAFAEYEGGEKLCRVDDRLVRGKSSILAPGDRVRLQETEDNCFIDAVAPRRTRLSRITGRGREKVFAANIDQLVVVASAAQPSFRPGLVDRYLIVAAIGGVEPVLVVNKMDLVDSEPGEVLVYRELGIPVVQTSCTRKEPLVALRAQLEGKVSVFAGHSGVGKSSILNVLLPNLDLDTREVSPSSGKGRHTTSASRLYRLDSTTAVIDTPGIRHLGIQGVDQNQLDLYFSDLAAIAVQCKFRDCSHVREPDCAVLTAKETGEITPLRYHSYLRIRETLDDGRTSF
ncbi:MAG: ribosome small subunit-dependent GTPase A [Candidatus Hydrogenedentes bacterium]|nr:ribosome small subunit-dependent GTPase A [Candidatus Hydrogenedentota bacterium]